METTIRLSIDVKKQLDKMRIHDKESYNDVIEFLIEDHLELNEKTKKELIEAEKRIKAGNFYTHEEVGKMLAL